MNFSGKVTLRGPILVLLIALKSLLRMMVFSVSGGATLLTSCAIPFLLYALKSNFKDLFHFHRRYFPTQALNFAFKEKIRELPGLQEEEGQSQVKKLGKYVTSGGLAGSASLLFVYSLDYARTRLANNVKKADGTREFNGLLDVYAKTIKKDGVLGLYRGFVISCIGIFVYR